jgi:hypothetical protein
LLGINGGGQRWEVGEERSPELGAAELYESGALNGSWAQEERSPYEWERNEFNEWYPMAQRFGLAEDYQWDGAEYWVFSKNQWVRYSELIGTFSCAWLKRYLWLGDGLSEHEIE